MSDIEDVTGPSRGLREDAMHAIAKQVVRGEQSDGIEIALHRTCVIESRPCGVERNAPVQTEHVGTSGTHCRQQACRIHPEVDDGHT